MSKAWPRWSCPWRLRCARGFPATQKRKCNLIAGFPKMGFPLPLLLGLQFPFTGFSLQLLSCFTENCPSSSFCGCLRMGGWGGLSLGNSPPPRFHFHYQITSEGPKLCKCQRKKDLQRQAPCKAVWNCSSGWLLLRKGGVSHFLSSAPIQAGAKGKAEQVLGKMKGVPV